MYHTYIIQSKLDKTYYVGITEDLVKRLKQHNSNSSKYTSSKAPYQLVWYGAFTTKEKALNFEKYLKSSSGFAFRNKHLV